MESNSNFDLREAERKFKTIALQKHAVDRHFLHSGLSNTPPFLQNPKNFPFFIFTDMILCGSCNYPLRHCLLFPFYDGWQPAVNCNPDTYYVGMLTSQIAPGTGLFLILSYL